MKLRLFLIINAIALVSSVGFANGLRLPEYGSSARCESSLVGSESNSVSTPIITYGLGSVVEEVSRSAVEANDDAIIWLKSKLGWSASWNTHDLSGDLRWGFQLLGEKASAAGFGRRQESGKEEFSIPTLAFQNQILKKLRPEISFQIKTRPSELTGRAYLEGLSRGDIFADTRSSRAFLHHTNHHFVSLLLMKANVLESFKRRAELLIRFADFVSARHAKAFEADMEKFLDEAAGRMDIATEITPLLAAVADGNSELASRLASNLRTALGSVSDSVYIASVFQSIAQDMLLGHSKFIPALRSDLEKFKTAGPTVERDAAIIELGDSLRAYYQ